MFDSQSTYNSPVSQPLLLPAFCATTPRWQQIKYLNDKLPMRSKHKSETARVNPGTVGIAQRRKVVR